MLARNRSGVTRYETQPSPRRAALRRAASDRPPTQIGGPPGWTGFGSSTTSVKRVKRPSNDAGDGPQSARQTAMPSSTRAPRSRSGTPAASNSFGNSPPTPTPKTTRPFDSTSREATSLAATEGCRSASRYTHGPIRTRRVSAAT